MQTIDPDYFFITPEVIPENYLELLESIEIKKESNKVEHLSCSKIFAEAMYNIHHKKSIDKLFINK